MNTRKLLAGLGVAVAAVLAAGYFAMAAGDLSRAVLHTKSGEHPVMVELALTPKDREVGLMNRPEMPADQGMLFRFDETRIVAMWMKNTLIPLDMLFIDDAGKVVTIKTNAQPLSLDVIPSGQPVRYVLELNGGAAARYDVAIGDRLESEIIPAQ
ncbi:DUF192 domain-containing protein [Aurantimonas sp. 22II-16-19i]|uniref:DUF192 domain-containing protein n=1 Tax=Aurantimonas sp. 22II-16-19i TaxID=1317114 RepID=UPI0009F7C2A0|nr:DUF192 domain-containing protein [Aurantimonas sp. 22II-16-19i]ORE90570.1 putative signal peptide protein [Aurantimonas sp. 22II-16-19i]